MIDLHSHILPRMDDGSRSVEESLALLEMERSQGVDTVVLTPHFYRWKESADHFLERRAKSFEMLAAALSVGAPDLLLGAEVAWFPTLAEYAPLERLRVGESGYFLLELPFEPWSARLLDQVYNLSCVTELTPVLAHVERYLSMESAEQIDALISMGLPMQMNADSLLSGLGRRRRLSLLKRGRWCLGSDCHSVDRRPPRMAAAARYLERRLGPDRAAQMTGWLPGTDLPGHDEDLT